MKLHTQHRYRAGAYRKRAFLAAIFFLLTGLSLYAGSSMFGTLLISVLGFFVAGKLIWQKAYIDIKSLRASEDVFVCTSVLCALLYSAARIYFDFRSPGGIDNLFLEGAFLIFALNLSKVYLVAELERPNAFLNKVDDFIPKAARVVEKKEEKIVFAAHLKEGDIILVKAGARIPADGVIKKGKTEIDDSLITGNTAPTPARAGDAVYGGTRNKLADILVKITAAQNASQFMRIIKALKKSERAKTKYVRPVFVRSRYSVAAVFVVMFGAWAYFSREPFALLFFLFFSMPAALLFNRVLGGCAAVRGARKKGIHALSVNTLGVFSAAEVCFIDKTGTITAPSGALKAHTAEVLAALAAKGKKLYILSGDNEEAVARIAKESGVEDYFSCLLPEGKAARVRAAQAEGKITAMTGDGFNDILALLQADVSVAFSKKESLHTNWVDILIKKSAVSALTDIIKIYNKFKLNMAQNIVIAFVFNILLLVFIYNRVAPAPWYSCLAFMLGGVAFTALNSMRLK